MGRRTDFELAGARALVTGAGSGIGRAIAVELARKGSHVLAVDVHGDTAEKTALACTEVGPEAHGLACDVTDLAAVHRLADAVAADHGPLDVLVNNAGVGMSGRLNDMTVDDWRWIRSVNLDGIVHCCHTFGPTLVERGRGHVVNVASALAYTMRATEPAYVTTKAAVLALTRCLRADWAAAGVGVTAVCPGVINTPIIEATRFVGDDGEMAEKAGRMFRRGHPPELVARDVVVAIRMDKALALSGWEARLGWWANRFLPVRFQQRIAAVPL
ncbi:MAG TPA: SDR family NAD(P)-dependent oxidoreductase [Acidimicrobiales bacterium]|nr:SDR family NAD(P)-dependent oxidoreductase [Acidimicrobiales bacterium]